MARWLSFWLLSLGVCTANVGCRSEILAGEPGASDDEYAGHYLSIDSIAFGIFKRSASRNLCVWAAFGYSPGGRGGEDDGLETPEGWHGRQAHFSEDSEDCFKRDPFPPSAWPGEARGVLTFGRTTHTFPCNVSFHGELASSPLQDGVARPQGIVERERFDVDDVAIDPSCDP